MAPTVTQREGMDFFSNPLAVHNPNTLRAPIRNNLILTQSLVQGTVECTPPSMRLNRNIIIHDPILNTQLSHLRHIMIEVEYNIVSRVTTTDAATKWALLA